MTSHLSVAVVPSTDTDLRAANVLAADAAVERVGLVDRKPHPSWIGVTHLPDLSGIDVVVGRGARTARVAREARLPVVLFDRPHGYSGSAVVHASPLGLGRSLGLSLDGEVHVTITRSGRPHRIGHQVTFPAPIGRVRAGRLHHGVTEAPVEGEWAGVMAAGTHRSLTVVDHAAFLEAVTLAAGVACMSLGLTDQPQPVWCQPDEYIAACERMGAVIAESINSSN